VRTRQDIIHTCLFPVLRWVWLLCCDGCGYCAAMMGVVTMLRWWEHTDQFYIAITYKPAKLRDQFNARHVHVEPILLSTDMISRDMSGLQRGVVRIWSHPLLQSNAHSCIVYYETDREKGNNRGASPNIVQYILIMGVVTQSKSCTTHSSTR